MSSGNIAGDGEEVVWEESSSEAYAKEITYSTSVQWNRAIMGTRVVAVCFASFVFCFICVFFFCKLKKCVIVVVLACWDNNSSVV